jgi:hypothetical protein
MEALSPASEPEGAPIPEPVEVLSSAMAASAKYAAMALVGIMMLML